MLISSYSLYSSFLNPSVSSPGALSAPGSLVHLSVVLLMLVVGPAIGMKATLQGKRWRIRISEVGGPRAEWKMYSLDLVAKAEFGPLIAAATSILTVIVEPLIKALTIVTTLVSDNLISLFSILWGSRPFPLSLQFISRSGRSAQPSIWLYGHEAQSWVAPGCASSSSFLIPRCSSSITSIFG